MFFFSLNIFLFLSRRGGGGQGSQKNAMVLDALGLRTLNFGDEFSQSMQQVKSRGVNLRISLQAKLGRFEISKPPPKFDIGPWLPTGFLRPGYRGIITNWPSTFDLWRTLERKFGICFQLSKYVKHWDLVGMFQHVSTCFNMFQPVLGTWLPAPCSVCIPNTPWIEIPLLVDFWGQELIALTCLIFCVDILYILCDIL